MVKIKEFDVFLCYNSNDRREVEKIAKQLKTRGINSWDKSEVPSGSLWQQELEREIENIKAVAIFIGNNHLGPWDNNEIQPFLRQFVRRGCPVIPVLLANAPEKPKLPLFLEENRWVDFRDSQSNPLEMLIWGIKGIRPLKLTLEDSEPQEFDVFLSHNSRDKDSVRIIANKLKKEGIVTWLDESQFVGGDEWQAKLYKVLDETNLAFFFIGKNAIGRWQYEEVDYLYNRYVSSGTFLKTRQS
ncbi:MAG: toll/interleukin-1 receptor domain-containing protein [Okeania sp. SIO3C4]|nr:toll/interleukin-1 receptor domain-containing protein [Okeania sp. SIO3C4]